MIDSVHQIIAGVVLLTVIGVAYGGRFVFTTVAGRFPANDLQKSFFRAGHAHAGVLVILGLLTMLLVETSDVPEPFATLSLAVFVAAILMPTGFFVSVIGKDPARPNRAVALLWVGAGVLVLGLLSAGIGLIVAGSTP
ncbi:MULTISPECIES: hypothetical protein [Microbacterium]|uniref:Integral membrane protein n=1 Tax=Microbacterium wangchenii TaxID=2541726 RepID=A0ABX5SUY8_9MICO|nr:MULTISPECIES: hypothetical protein [Microbacterium]MCK6068460.1 hypothetical protein [Microbacterium sp. EYE_512]QBR90018.1 hypothetical protein E4K62_15770 [Microbacterium wangchenii]TXK09262.1 hypothetical protein FVP99_18030 [Microbacterium wangchenii]